MVGGDASAIGGALETVAGDGRARQVCRNDGMESKARDCRDQLYSFRSRMEWRGGGEFAPALLVGSTCGNYLTRRWFGGWPGNQ